MIRPAAQPELVGVRERPPVLLHLVGAEQFGPQRWLFDRRRARQDARGEPRTQPIWKRENRLAGRDQWRRPVVCRYCCRAAGAGKSIAQKFSQRMQLLDVLRDDLDDDDDGNRE